jgi:hypothetical protein
MQERSSKNTAYRCFANHFPSANVPEEEKFDGFTGIKAILTGTIIIYEVPILCILFAAGRLRAFVLFLP